MDWRANWEMRVLETEDEDYGCIDTITWTKIRERIYEEYRKQMVVEGHGCLCQRTWHMM